MAGRHRFTGGLPRGAGAYGSSPVPAAGVEASVQAGTAATRTGTVWQEAAVGAEARWRVAAAAGSGVGPAGVRVGAVA